MTVRVVLADDDALARAGMATLLDAGEGIEVVSAVGDGLAAVAACHVLQPDVAVLDVRMPALDGVGATARIVRDHDGAIGVLALTTYEVDEALFACLRAGASGFLLKDAAPSDLVVAVRAVATGGAWLDSALTRTLIMEYARQPAPPTPAIEIALLTTREREVLVHVAHGRTNAEIAQRLVVAEATVKTHVRRVMAKLDVHDRASAVAVAFRSGLVPSDNSRPSS